MLGRPAIPRASLRFLRSALPPCARFFLLSRRRGAPRCRAGVCRRDRHAKPLRRVDVAFRNFGTRRLPPLSISGLNHTACALAVYASQPGSPLDHARLASGWGLALAGRVWLPARSLVKFPRYFMASSSPRLPWRIQNSIVTLDEGLAARDAGAQCPSLSLYWVLCAPPSGPARISHSRTSRCEATRPAPPSLDATAVRTPRSRFLGVPLSPLGRVARGAPCRSPRDSDSFASAGVSRLLDLEVPPRANGSTRSARSLRTSGAPLRSRIRSGVRHAFTASYSSSGSTSRSAPLPGSCRVAQRHPLKPGARSFKTTSPTSSPSTSSSYRPRPFECCTFSWSCCIIAARSCTST